jgi:exosortase family protein XrtM
LIVDPSLPGAGRVFFSPLGFAAKLLAGFALLYFAAAAARDTEAYRLFVEEGTVRPAAALVNVLVPDEAAAARGPALVSPRARLTVLSGCEGIEAMLLLCAGFLAAPLGWRARLGGVAGGLALVYALNQARLVALWFALRHDHELFALLHGVVAPALLVGAACAYFAWRLERRPA